MISFVFIFPSKGHGNLQHYFLIFLHIHQNYYNIALQFQSTKIRASEIYFISCVTMVVSQPIIPEPQINQSKNLPQNLTCLHCKLMTFIESLS